MKFIKHLFKFIFWAIASWFIFAFIYFKSWPLYWRLISKAREPNNGDETKINYDDMPIYYGKGGIC